MHACFRSVVAPALVAAVTFAALSGVRAKVTDRAPFDGVTIVEKASPAAAGAADAGAPSFPDPARIRAWLALQAIALDLRPSQQETWNRYALALTAVLKPPAAHPSTAGDPIAASRMFAAEMVARGPAATSLAAAAAELHAQLRPEQIVRASNLIPPPWRVIRQAAPSIERDSAETSSPRRSAEREAVP